VIPRPAGARRDRAHETEVCKIKLIDEQVNNANKIILTDPIFQPFRKKHRLAALDALN